MARAKIDGEKSKLQLAHRAWIPDPALMVKGQRYNDAAEAVSELDAGVSFTIPWVNPGKYSAGVREARANLAAAEQGLEREQKEALRLLRDQLAKIETFHHHVELFHDKLVPQAQQAFEATQLSYESGKATFLDWISAQRNLRDIEAMGRDIWRTTKWLSPSWRQSSAQTFTRRPQRIERKEITMKMFTQEHSCLSCSLRFFLARPSCSKKGAVGKTEQRRLLDCTMHPSVHEEGPGKCPICSMDLVPVMKRGRRQAPANAA